MDRRALKITTFAEDARANPSLRHWRSRPPAERWQPSSSFGGSSLDLTPDFDEFCALLAARSIEFVVVGAHALAFHGAPALYGRLDIFVRPTADNGARLLRCHPGVRVSDSLTYCRRHRRRRQGDRDGGPARSDPLISQIDGVTWDEVWAAREVGAFGSGTVAFIGRDAFLRNKRAAGQARKISPTWMHCASPRPNNGTLFVLPITNAHATHRRGLAAVADMK